MNLANMDATVTETFDSNIVVTVKRHGSLLSTAVKSAPSLKGQKQGSGGYSVDLNKVPLARDPSLNSPGVDPVPMVLLYQILKDGVDSSHVSYGTTSDLSVQSSPKTHPMLAVSLDLHLVKAALTSEPWRSIAKSKDPKLAVVIVPQSAGGYVLQFSVRVPDPGGAQIFSDIQEQCRSWQ